VRAGAHRVKFDPEVARSGIEISDVLCDAPGFWLQRWDLEVRLPLFELDEPAQRTGATLIICGALNEDIMLSAYLGGTHDAGFAGKDVLREFLCRAVRLQADSTRELTLELVDPQFESGKPLASGSWLRFRGGDVPELRFYIGPHCLGAAMGADLMKFVRGVLIRASRGVRSDNVVCITDTRRRAEASGYQLAG
jgi:hypothetical protein